MMKRSVLLSAAVLLVGAVCARADLITNVTGGVPSGMFSYTRTTVDANTDLLEIHYANWYLGNTSRLLQAIEGTFTPSADSTAGVMYFDPSDDWLYNADPNSGMVTPPAVPYSWVNFTTPNESAVWNRVNVGSAYTLLQGGWMTSTATKKLRPVDTVTETPAIDQTLFAKIYVSHLDGLTYTGKLGLYGVSTSPTGSFTIPAVPEPSTIALLGCGLFGLLAYAWRKRK